MAELPVLPITTAALIADTVHMSAEQFGAYVRILLAMWQNGAELADDDTCLARIAGVTFQRWRSIRDVVLGPVNSTDGMLHQKRLTATWNGVQKVRVKRVTAANERWNRERAQHAHGPAHAYASGYAKPMHTEMHMQSTCNAILNKKDSFLTSSSFPTTARASENPTKSTDEDSTSEPNPPVSQRVETPAGLAMEARKAVQNAAGSIGSGELVELITSKWLR